MLIYNLTQGLVSYVNTRKALVIGHMGLGDHIYMIGAVRYIAAQHTETYVVCKREYVKNLQSFFADNPTIKFWPVDSPYLYGKGPTETAPGECVIYNPFEWANVYRSGYYKLPRSGFDDIAKNFYVDMGIDPNVRHSHFYVPLPPSVHTLYEKVKGREYIFVQQKSSSHVTNLIQWDVDKILTIDPNINVYPVDHPWYELAQAFVNQPFLDYVEVIKHAKEIHIVNSSFYCIACHYPLDANVKKCYLRETGEVIPEYNFH
jgi:hypothetical protein